MTVAVVADSACGLSTEEPLARGVAVVPLHVVPGDDHETTSGVSALELAAAYSRHLALGGDDGVVALPLSKELSGTWASAVMAAGVFDTQVKVVDTDSVGMALGCASAVAAALAEDGASVEECYSAAVDCMAHSDSWLYVHKVDDLRRSGRLTKGMIISTALVVRPIVKLHEGRLELAGKTRTRAKGMQKLSDFIVNRVHEAGDEPVFLSLQESDAVTAANELRTLLEGQLAEGSIVDVRPMSPALAVHTGAGALGVTLVTGSPQVDVLRKRYAQGVDHIS